MIRAIKIRDKDRQTRTPTKREKCLPFQNSVNRRVVVLLSPFSNYASQLEHIHV